MSSDQEEQTETTETKQTKESTKPKKTSKKSTTKETKLKPLTLNEKIAVSVVIVVVVIALAIGLGVGLGLKKESSSSSSSSIATSSSSASSSGTASGSTSSSAIASGSTSSSIVTSSSASVFTIVDGANYTITIPSLAAAINTCFGCYNSGGTDCTNQGVILDTAGSSAIEMILISGSTYNMRIAVGFVFAGNFLFTGISGGGIQQLCTSGSNPGTTAEFVFTIISSASATSGFVLIQSVASGFYGRACTTGSCPTGFFADASPISFDLTLVQAQVDPLAQFLMIQS